MIVVSEYRSRRPINKWTDSTGRGSGANIFGKIQHKVHLLGIVRSNYITQVCWLPFQKCRQTATQSIVYEEPGP